MDCASAGANNLAATGDAAGHLRFQGSQDEVAELQFLHPNSTAAEARSGMHLGDALP